MRRPWLFLSGIVTVIALYNVIGYRFFDGVCWLAGRGAAGGVWSQEHLNWAATSFHFGVVLAVAVLAVGLIASLKQLSSAEPDGEGSCPGCGRPSSRSWSLCPYCGTSLRQGNGESEVTAGA